MYKQFLEVCIPYKLYNIFIQGRLCVVQWYAN